MRTRDDKGVGCSAGNPAFLFLIAYGTRAATAMAGISHHNNLTAITYTLTHIVQPYVQLVIQQVILTFILTLLERQAGVVRHPSLIQTVIFVTVQVRNLLTVSREVNKHKITLATLIYEALHLTRDAGTGSLLVLQGHDILCLKTVLLEHRRHYGNILISVDGLPTRRFGVSSNADYQSSLRRLHRPYGQYKGQNQKCKVAFHRCITIFVNYSLYVFTYHVSSEPKGNPILVFSPQKYKKKLNYTKKIKKIGIFYRIIFTFQLFFVSLHPNLEGMAKILVIDDERAIRNSLKDILELEGYSVSVAEDGVSGIQAAEKEPFDLIYTDIKMPGIDGIEVLEKLHGTCPIVMISGHGTIETAVEAIKKGAFDFIEKPFDLNRLLVTTRNALTHKDLSEEVGQKTEEIRKLKKKVEKQHSMVGESPAITHVREIISKVAPTEARVLITGENGTGKEVVARLLHAQSNRAQAPLVEVNCAAIPSELIESELFGHIKGSFTGAVKDRAGKFEQADGGTLFLDEIGDMSLAAQTKVLRALQESEITRVGSDKAIKVNVRVIAATNKDLAKEIAEGNFREDLYHRLNVIPIHVPRLEDRKEDIPLLVNYFAEQICDEQGWKIKAFEPAAIKALEQRPWPGNIRELRNVVERLIILSGETIREEDVRLFA